MDGLTGRLAMLADVVQERVPNLNCGGCGVFAALVTTRLEALGVRAWGQISMEREDAPYVDLDAIRANNGGEIDGQALYDNGVYCRHIVTRFRTAGRTYLFDSNTLEHGRQVYEHTTNGRLVRGRLKPRELMTLARDASLWNPAFNRPAYTPVIRRAVDRYLPLAGL